MHGAVADVRFPEVGHHTPDEADQELTRAIDAGEAAATIEWSSAGYEAIYKLSTASVNQDVSEDELESFLREIVEKGIDSATDPAGPVPAVLARYIAMEQLQFRLSDDEKKEMLDTQADIILGVLDYTESVGLRLTLVDVYGEQEQWEAQADALLTAAKMNRGIDPINQIYFNQINDKLTAMEEEERIDSEKAGEIHEALLAWSEDMADVNRAAAAAIDLDKFNIDPLPGDRVGSGDGGSEPEDSTESDPVESGSGDG